MKKLSLDVEVIGGASIEQAVDHICELSNQLDLMVCTRFCGQDLMAMPGDDADKIIEKYNEAALYLREFENK